MERKAVFIGVLRSGAKTVRGSVTMDKRRRSLRNSRKGSGRSRKCFTIFISRRRIASTREESKETRPEGH